MLKCGTCGRYLQGSLTAEKPNLGFCDGCGCFIEGRLCEYEDCQHINFVDARFCRTCGRADRLTAGTRVTEETGNGWMVVLALVVIGGVVLWLTGWWVYALFVGIAMLALVLIGLGIGSASST